MPRTFAALTTIRVGGPSREFVEVTDPTELVETVRAADAAGTPVLVMAGGSNLVVGDQGWDGLTVRVATSGVAIDGATVVAEAGADWDGLVRATIEAGLSGLETLSGIPGSVGGTPIQNVGAYGTQVSDVLTAVTVYDRHTGEVQEWGADRCGFGRHRTSVFKRNNRYVIVRVTYQLRPSTTSVPLTYGSLVSALGVAPGETADVGDVRAAVLDQRRRRGSIYDPGDPDTWGTGSFFLNPVVAEVPEPARSAPSYPDELGTKLPAGWLIEHAGFPRGYGADWASGRVRLSTKHALAVSNRGEATTAEVMAFAAHVRAGVEARFGIRLEPECDLVNCSLDDAEIEPGPSVSGR
jgi:UDP-N-acetylmuramate dehydrogenase